MRRKLILALALLMVCSSVVVVYAQTQIEALDEAIIFCSTMIDRHRDWIDYLNTHPDYSSGWDRYDNYWTVERHQEHLVKYENILDQLLLLRSIIT